MARHFTDAETAAWLKDQPKKPMSSKVVLSNPEGKLLVVKPNYRPGWSFVGGMVDANESPLQGAIRETKEEIKLDIPAARLKFLGARYGVSSRSGDDYVHFIFKSQLTEQEIEKIVLDTSELESMRWISPDEIDSEMNDHTYKFVLKILHNEAAMYSEHDTFQL